MKIIILIISLLLILTSCNKVDVSKENISKVTKDWEYYKKIKKDIKKIKSYYKEYEKLELEHNKCFDDMNIIYTDNLKICIPKNWVWYSPYSWEIHDILKENKIYGEMWNKNLFELNWNYKDIDIIQSWPLSQEYHRIWDSFILWINNNKILEIDNIDNIDYIHSTMVIDTWKEIIKFRFNIKDPTHRQIIKSIEILN